jgi:hypothetical protein
VIESLAEGLMMSYATSPQLMLSDDLFDELGQQNRDLRLERPAKGVAHVASDALIQ